MEILNGFQRLLRIIEDYWNPWKIIEIYGKLMEIIGNCWNPLENRWDF